MYDQEEVIEGLLCPICMKDLGTVTKLQEHFENTHESVDSALLQSIKELYGKAKKKILKQDEAGGAGIESDDLSDPQARGFGLDFEEEPQEIGVTCNHMDLFKKQRHARMNNYALETNKLLNRLYRLITDIPSEPDRRKDHEKEVVPWVLDKDVKLCPNCATSFNLSKRRHHCRLCGGIMCQNCSQFIEITTAKKLTQDMFPSNSSIRSPSPVKSESLSRRNSSSALLAMVTSPPDPLIRLCSFCKTILDKQDIQLQLKTNKPALVQLYEKMKHYVDEVEKLLPQYQLVVDSLNAGEENYTLQEGQEMRVKLMRLAESVDGISRKIGILGSHDNLPVAPIVLQVQGCVRMTASVFLRDNLLGMPSLPDEKKFAELKTKRLKEVQKRIQYEKMSALEAFQQSSLAEKKVESSKSTDSVSSSGKMVASSLTRPTQLGAPQVRQSGWRPQVKGENIRGNEDPMIQQMNIIRDYIHQAREANKMDEAQMLENNLKELQEEYARINLSPS